MGVQTTKEKDLNQPSPFSVATGVLSPHNATALKHWALKHKGHVWDTWNVWYSVEFPKKKKKKKSFCYSLGTVALSQTLPFSHPCQ